jgi:uncharacterized membrane protein YkvA (DUF1232 family)
MSSGARRQWRLPAATDGPERGRAIRTPTLESCQVGSGSRPAWGATLLVHGGFVIALVVAGRRSQALAGFIPDCIVLFRRLLADDQVPRSRKALMFAVIAYLAMPFDLVPDFIPIAGQLDDAVIVGLVLRSVLRAGGPDLLREH